MDNLSAPGHLHHHICFAHTPGTQSNDPVPLQGPLAAPRSTTRDLSQFHTSLPKDIAFLTWCLRAIKGLGLGDAGQNSRSQGRELSMPHQEGRVTAHCSKKLESEIHFLELTCRLFFKEKRRPEAYTRGCSVICKETEDVLCALWLI